MALQIKTFRITDAESEQAVNTFLAGKRVHHWEASYSGDPSLGIWNLFVACDDEHHREHRDSRDGRDSRDRGDRMSTQRRPAEPKRPAQARAEQAPPDIDASLMPLYENVRRWRNQVAREEKLKPYVLFNNKQLEEMVKTSPADMGSLKTLAPDMTEEILGRYGNQLLGLFSASSEVAAG